MPGKVIAYSSFGSAVDLDGAEVTGTLPITKGGTGGATQDLALTGLGFPANFVHASGNRWLPKGVMCVGQTYQLIAAVAWFLYLGQTPRILTPTRIRTTLTTVATTDSVGELGFFTTPLPGGTGANQTMTPVAGAFKTAWDDLTAVGGAAPRRVGNAVALAVAIPAGVHLWAGVRTNTGGNEPVFTGAAMDVLGGNILTLAAAAAFDGTTTYAATVPAIGATGATSIGPWVWAEFD